MYARLDGNVSVRVYVRVDVFVCVKGVGVCVYVCVRVFVCEL